MAIDSGKIYQMCEADIRLLPDKRALLPPISVQEAMLRGYVYYVHPFMPVLDLDQFCLFPDSRHHTEEGPLSHISSLLVLQSLMFSGSAYVKLHDVQKSGYKSRKAFRAALYNRAKVLFESDNESNPLALIQSALLLSTWHQNSESRDTRHWISTAVSIAQKENLHHEEHYSTLSGQNQRFQKKLWWACYIRDRLAALGLGRPMVIDHNASNISLLSTRDFHDDSQTEESTVTSSRVGCSSSNPFPATLQGALTIEMSKLCVHITHILEVNYSTSFIKQGLGSICAEANGIPVLSPDAKCLDPLQFEENAKLLEQWASELSVNGYLNIEDDVSEFSTKHPPHTIVNVSFLHLTYHAASSALHRLRVQWTDIKDQAHNTSYQKLSKSTTEVTSIVTKLVRMDLARFLPPSGAVSLLPAMIGHIRRMQSTDFKIKIQAMADFQQCVQVLQSLTDISYIGDYALNFLDAVTKKLKVSLPFRLNPEPEDRTLGNLIFDSTNLHDEFLHNGEHNFLSNRSDCHVSGLEREIVKSEFDSTILLNRGEKDKAESSWDSSLYTLLVSQFPSDLYRP